MTAEDRILAAELAIGLLDGEERASASARATVDPDFAQEVDWWQQRMAPFYAQVGDVSPPSYLRERIAARLEVPSLDERRSRSRWRLLGLGGAIGALAASIVAWTMSPDTPVSTVAPHRSVIAPRPLVASLLPADKSAEPPIVVMLEPGAARLRLSATIEVSADRDVQLWLIRAGAAAPISLGVLSSAADRQLRLRKADLPVAGDQLAASIEPVGGSPTGQPTGPVVFSGKVAQI